MAVKGRPTSVPEEKAIPTVMESCWLDHARKHLTRKELVPHVSSSSSHGKKHTPWTEFCKCLHFFASGILNKEELVLLLKGLFVQGHAPKSGADAGGGAVYPEIQAEAALLMNEFETVLLGRGRFAEQTDMQLNKSKYGSFNLAGINFQAEGCEHPTPSYYSLPEDYPSDKFFKHSVRTSADKKVINADYVAPVRRSMEDDYLQSRQNFSVYADEMFKLEDERFEVDMAIERNASAIKNLERLDAEVRELKEIEEKEGQPCE